MQELTLLLVNQVTLPGAPAILDDMQTDIQDPHQTLQHLDLSQSQQKTITERGCTQSDLSVCRPTAAAFGASG